VQSGKLFDAGYGQLSSVCGRNEMPCDLASGSAPLEVFAGKVKGNLSRFTFSYSSALVYLCNRIVKWSTSYLGGKCVSRVAILFILCIYFLIFNHRSQSCT
jgi:hypothetical protein